MITALLLLALAITPLLIVLLPFGGWGAGMDAAGRGMAMFPPVVAMSIRFIALAVAAGIVGFSGGLAWIGLPPLATGLLALALLAGLGVMSLAAASLLGDDPYKQRRRALGWCATVATPLAVTLWLFAERYAAAPPLDGITRGLVLALALLSLWLLVGCLRRMAADKAAAEASAKAEADTAADAVARTLDNASMEETLRYLDAVGAGQFALTDLIGQRIKARPDRAAAFMQLLESDDHQTRILAGFHSGLVALEHMPGYFDRAALVIGEVTRRLGDPALPDPALKREALAAIRLGWPSTNQSYLSKALVRDLHAAIAARAGSRDDWNGIAYDAKMLAEQVET